ncbi:hypothetical protein FACS1894167_06020 [Synergistales bacterium]|nr:hypothetical protein FACS1894167_06020 [Synergistales bacterium]GHV53068.1 hypothetical protein FACS1894216_10360 [Synergistales bacterium]
MLRPIDANMPIVNSERMASQIKDPSSHHVMVLQQEDLSKRIDHETHSVQPADESEGEVKVRSRKDEEKQEDGRGKKKRGSSARDGDGEQEKKHAEARNLFGSFTFLA